MALKVAHRLLGDKTSSRRREASHQGFSQLGISDFTARAWAEKYLNEVREQNMRDRAEGRES